MEYLESLRALLITSYLGLLLYWLPLALCVYGYTVRLHRDIQADKKKRDSESWYSPKVTVGTIIGYGVLSALPVANLFAALFDVAPEVFGRFFDWVDKVFNTPIIPDTPAAAAAREERRNAKNSHSA